MARGIIPQISPRQAARLLKKGNAPPHLIRYWLTPPVDVHREETLRAICTVYQDAPRLMEQGEQTMSTDELTGVQAASTQASRIAPGTWEGRAS